MATKTLPASAAATPPALQPPPLRRFNGNDVSGVLFDLQAIAEVLTVHLDRVEEQTDGDASDAAHSAHRVVRLLSRQLGELGGAMMDVTIEVRHAATLADIERLVGGELSEELHPPQGVSS